MKSISIAYKILIVLLAAVALGLVLAVTVGSQPGTCASCHSAQAVALADSAHFPIGCYDCHAFGAEIVGFKAAEIARMYPRGLFGGQPRGAVSVIGREACEACHVDVLGSATEGVTGIRIVHETCATGITCDPCHATVAHGDAVRWIREPVMEDCTGCHQRSDAPIACDTCHLERSLDDRLSAGPWQVTHGPNWQSTHGMGALDSCVVCHPDDYCVRCHGVAVPHPDTFGGEHGQQALAPEAKCDNCHRSGAYCDSCHGTEMPHPAGFLRRHSDEAGTIDNPACIRCHAVEDCERCHVRHVHPGGPSMYPTPGPTTRGGQ